MGRGSLSKR
jgi:hypothetical protein